MRVVADIHNNQLATAIEDGISDRHVRLSNFIPIKISEKTYYTHVHQAQVLAWAKFLVRAYFMPELKPEKNFLHLADAPFLNLFTPQKSNAHAYNPVVA